MSPDNVSAATICDWPGVTAALRNFDDPADTRMLASLIDAADIIIESSRPRALRQLGIDRDRAVANGATWVGITGHGGSGDAAGRIGFGDDAAVLASC
jgi:crotonobetainyl-CoA:carnitine CoA-transferase CaiB-like acyl-CoA transferase